MNLHTARSEFEEAIRLHGEIAKTERALEQIYTQIFALEEKRTKLQALLLNQRNALATLHR